MPEITRSDSHTDRETIGAVLGRTPSGVFVLTAGDGNGRETGMLASWVQQASFEPPSITVAVNKSRYLNQWLQQSPRLAVNILGQSQGRLLKHFARGFEPDQPAFEGLATSRGSTGLSILTDAVGYLEGEVTDSIDAGDHMVYLVRISGAGAGADLNDTKPMVHLRKSGFSY